MNPTALIIVVRYARPAGLALRKADVLRVNRKPQDVIGDHPSIRQEYIRSELYGYHLRIDLNDNPFQPAAHALASFVMIAIDFDHISYLKGVDGLGSFHVRILSHNLPSFSWTEPAKLE